VLASYDPNNPSTTRNAAVIAALGQLVNLKYGRDDELEADRLGVQMMAQAGYDPRAMIGVMEVLRAAGGGGRQPEFFSSHPTPRTESRRYRPRSRRSSRTGFLRASSPRTELPMPEGPEVRRYADSLHEALAGKQITVITGENKSREKVPRGER
jgi:predicted Zn-dependent protease